MDYQVKIGLVPLRRDVTARPGAFNWERAETRCAESVNYIKAHFTDGNICFVDLEGINDVGVLYSEKDVDAVISHFREENVDAVFLINGNFGNEEVAGMVAKALGKPVLLWGPQDDVFEPDGTRYTDSQCGLFGTSRMLQRMNIPFSYIENCHIEDPMFAEGLLKFAGVACAVKNFTGMRIAQVGCRPKPFCSVICNESELMEKFDIRLIPISWQWCWISTTEFWSRRRMRWLPALPNCGKCTSWMQPPMQWLKRSMPSFCFIKRFLRNTRSPLFLPSAGLPCACWLALCPAPPMRFWQIWATSSAAKAMSTL